MSSLFEDLAFRVSYWSPYVRDQIPSTRLHEVLWEKAGHLFDIVITHLFSPVSKVAGIVCVVGILLFAVSFLISEDKSSTNANTIDSNTDNQVK